ncbi:MAG TPA: ATP synthase F1 subunit delta [Deltaproteobacteria bacterium]|nr:ATP synthase F1 subunit delta [Deltaproteobacteria bacterium]
MRRSSVAKRYAKALMEIGREEKSVERFGDELRSLAATFRGSPALCKVLLNPMYRLEERKALAAGLAEKLGASERVARLLEILVEGRKVRLVGEIAQAYARMEDELAGRLRVGVEAASPLGKELLESISGKLGDETGKEIILSFEEKPELIGGVVIRMGNTIFDGSLRGQLERMREKILGGVV